MTQKIRKFLPEITAALIILLCEIFLFNAGSFAKGTTDQYISTDLITAEGAAVNENGKITITGSSTLTIDSLPSGIKYVIPQTHQKESNRSILFQLSLQIEDDSLSRSYETVQHKFTMAQGRNAVLSVDPYGSLHSIKLIFSDIEEEVTLTSVRVTSKKPFYFSIARFLTLLALTLFLMHIIKRRIWRVKYDERNALHNFLIQSIAVLCTLSTVLFIRPGDALVEYNSKSPMLADPFAMTFDAFHKGQVFLELDVDEKLEQLDNVYDRSVRDDSGAHWYWDLAFYKGKYYTYFGAAPVVTFYYPVYFLTGKLPTLAAASWFFSAIAAFFLCQTILALARRLAPSANLLLLLAVMPAAVSCSGALTAANFADTYFLPVAAALAFLYLCLWSGISAENSKKPAIRYALYALSGTAFALCVGSRPITALGAVILLPFFFGVLRNDSISRKIRAASALSFCIPVFFGAMIIMHYNSLRFDSPFNFGAAYQLTVSDVRANRLTFSGIAPMLYHYFLQLPCSRDSFPYFQPAHYNLNNYSRYVYTSDMIGALTYPFIVLGMILVPKAVQMYKKAPVSRRRQTLQFIILCATSALLIGWLDMCLAGLNQRYVTDIMAPLILLSSVMLLSTVRIKDRLKYRYIAAHLCTAATFVISWLMFVQVRGGSLSRHCPDLYDALASMFNV